MTHREAAERLVPSPYANQGCEADIQSAAALIEAHVKEHVEAATKELEKALLEELQNRDDVFEWADRLAYAIAPQEVIGEHSSANCPWQNALDIALAAAPTGKEEGE